MIVTITRQYCIKHLKEEPSSLDAKKVIQYFHKRTPEGMVLLESSLAYNAKREEWSAKYIDKPKETKK